MNKTFEDVILKDMGIPLNAKMLKETKVYEGDPEFLYKLQFMTKGYVFEDAERDVEIFQLNPKAINFMSRMLLQFYQVPVLALQDACMSGMLSNASGKQIEAQIKQLVEQHGRDTEKTRQTP
tara:strand:- start:13256 stop:13621 length:366 start_codon:yes stop_codon:yes gene_type:complete